jgi:hypothetical protein
VQVANQILWFLFGILVVLQIFADSVMKDDTRNMDADSQITEVHDGTVPIKHRRNWSLGSHLQFHNSKFSLSRTSSRKSSSSTSLASMDVQEASNEHAPHIPLMKKLIGFGSNYNLKELFFHHEDSISEESPTHHHHHGTRYKNVFGYEDAATESAQRRFDVFGYNDAKDVEAYKRSSQLFGSEDLEFETGQRGRDLFGNDDVASEEAQMTRQVFGFEDANSESSQEGRHIFGDDGEEGTEISDAEVEEDDDAVENVPVALPVNHLKTL